MKIEELIEKYVIEHKSSIFYINSYKISNYNKFNQELKIKFILKYKNIYTRSLSGGTILSFAIQYNYNNLLEELIKCNLDVNHPSQFPYLNPIIKAIYHNNSYAIDLLIKYKQEINYNYDFLWSFWFSCRFLNHIDFKKIFENEIVINKNNINSQDILGNTILHKLCDKRYKSHLDLNKNIEYLILNGVDVNIKNNNSLTALDLLKENRNEFN